MAYRYALNISVRLEVEHFRVRPLTRHKPIPEDVMRQPLLIEPRGSEGRGRKECASAPETGPEAWNRRGGRQPSLLAPWLDADPAHTCEF